MTDEKRERAIQQSAVPEASADWWRDGWDACAAEQAATVDAIREEGATFLSGRLAAQATELAQLRAQVRELQHRRIECQACGETATTTPYAEVAEELAQLRAAVKRVRDVMAQLGASPGDAAQCNWALAHINVALATAPVPDVHIAVSPEAVDEVLTTAPVQDAGPCRDPAQIDRESEWDAPAPATEATEACEHTGERNIDRATGVEECNDCGDVIQSAPATEAGPARGARFLERVAAVEAAYEGEEFPTVLAAECTRHGTCLVERDAAIAKAEALQGENRILRERLSRRAAKKGTET